MKWFRATVINTMERAETHDIMSESLEAAEKAMEVVLLRDYDVTYSVGDVEEIVDDA